MSYTIEVDADQYREMYHADTAVYDKVDQWVDWGGHTQTVDPMHNSAWIHEGQEGKHLGTVNRGRDYDARDVRHLQGLLANQHRPALEPFLPTTADLDRLPKFPSRRSRGCDTWRGNLRDLRGVGEMPVIRARLDSGALGGKDKETIERECYDAQHRIAERVLSRDGKPDHGVAC